MKTNLILAGGLLLLALVAPTRPLNDREHLVIKTQS
jgi:hypothetical protein